ncbi:MAG: radical SAM protein [Candidatus Thorarchaeota archaeon]|nr:MAG: radical SAM protein [Candidatus Thorarchaeota archaeon]
MHYEYHRNQERCSKCRYCITRVSCPSPNSCVGCRACYLACPSEAIEETTVQPKSAVTITVDGQRVEVPGDTTIKVALEHLGYSFSRYIEDAGFFAPCETGGCYACSVLVNNQVRQSCHTAVSEGQRIETRLSQDQHPIRIVGWHQAHSVGGVGTPWPEKGVGRGWAFYAEAACFSAGCNLRCRTCQNHDVTYDSRAKAVTPEEAARHLLQLRERVAVHRMAISGGEATLNRPWLLRFFRHLKENAPSGSRLHLDTNATVLTKDYIEKLIDAGMTDIGPDLKAVSLETFQTISGVTDSNLAKRYLETSWNAVRHLLQNHYPENVFVGIGLPFNPMFYTSIEVMDSELHEWASRLISLNDQVQVTVLDYRPEFRRADISRPSIDEMKNVKSFLEGVGLRTVIAQTAAGHLAPTTPAPDIEMA